MQTGLKYISIVVLIAVFSLPARSVLPADGTITGTVTFEMEDGRVEPGNWIRILLVTSKVPVPETDASLVPGEPAFFDAISYLHSDFYIQVQNRLAKKDFLYASTLSTDEGTFKIPAVAPGDYFIVVTYPGMIRGYKVAWQIPVRVLPGETTHIRLNRDNMALPTGRR
jgi:hypothetical protein